MEFQEAKAIAERLGFQLFADVRGDTNALRLFTEDFRQKYGKKYRCGVYMQFRADGSCYIGQSLDVDRRHKRHRELGVIVDYLAFRCWPPSVLMEKEDLCIQDALALGVPLVNKTLKCGTLKKSDDYDQIFTPDEQDLFIERIAARQTPLTQWPNFCKNAERSELRDWSAFVKLVRMLRPSRRRHRIRGRQRTLHAFSSAPAKTAAARRRFEIDSLSQAFLESISWLESAPCQYSTHRSHTKLLASTWLLQRSTLISRNPISLTALPTTSVMNSLRSRLKFEDESSQLTSYSCSKIYFRRLR